MKRSRGATPPLVIVVSLAVLLLIGVEQVPAQEVLRPSVATNTLNGSVVDSSGVAVPGATIEVISASGEVVSKTQSGQSGEFAIPRLSPARYRVRELVNDKIVGDAEVTVGASEQRPIRLVVGNFFATKRVSSTRGGAGAEAQGQVVRVFYATDRQPVSTQSRYGQNYGSNRSLNGTTAYGTAFVSIPRDHRMGELENASFWSFSFLASAADSVAITRARVEDPSTFFGDVHSAVDGSASKSAFVFIHGYNVSFEDGLKRTAQLAYDLGFDGPPILYSWPSKGGTQDYVADEESVQWSTDHLRVFLENVARQTGAQKIHLIAHSMGNRALLGALSILNNQRSTLKFQEVVLAAPDIDADLFRQLAPATTALAFRVTMYASSADIALISSRHFHQFSRAGESGNHLTIVPPVDTIDATRVDTGFLGHSYFADQRSVLADIFALLRYDLAPNRRFGLDQERSHQLVYWILRP